MAIQEKINQLLAKLSLQEKCSLLSGESFWYTQPLEQHDIPAIMLTDGPHGLRKQGEIEDHLGINESVPATCFPSGAGLAASWNVELAGRMGRALGVECRQEDVSVLLGPGMNIKRSPLCGRNFEYLSEDPYLSSHMGASYIQGVQSTGVGTSVKHFACNNQETKRLTMDVTVDERSLREIYLASFEHAIKAAKPYTVMCAYNKINGEFGSEHNYLLNEILRDEWGYDGVVVTDWGATNERVKGLLAGLDLEMPASAGINDRKVEAAVAADPSLETDLDKVVARLLHLVFRCTGDLPDVERFDAEKHHQLARQVAHECMVLLKNQQQLLPLKRQDRLAVFGEFAVKPRYQGGGSSHTNPTFMTNVLDSLQGYAEQVTYQQGFGIYDDELDHSQLAAARQLASEVDKIVIVGGLPERYETEGIDRKHMHLPQAQLDLIRELSEVNPNIVVVLSNGSPVEMPFEPHCQAIIEGYLLGQAGGQATADVLYGEVSPSGKLAETFPLRLQDNPSYLNFPGEGYRVNYAEGIFVGYRYYDSKQMAVRYPFGHGLSYTSFKYSNLRVSASELTDQDTLQLSIDITNSGEVAGQEVVQLYVHDRQLDIVRPDQELKGFTKLTLQPGETRTAHFTLNKRSFAYYDVEQQDWLVQNGQFDLRVGSSSRDIRQTAEVTVSATKRRTLRVHRNTTFGEILKNEPTRALGRQYIDYFIEKSGIDFNLGDNADDFAETVISDFPLKNQVLFCKGQFTEVQLDALLAELNSLNQG